MQLRSTAFVQGEIIPEQYGYKRNNINPPLTIDDLPQGTQSLALIMDDPDVPEWVRKDRLWVHWVLYNIPPTTTTIEEKFAGKGAIIGKNSGNEASYMGPAPPDREHRYFFKLYALDTMLDLAPGATKGELLEAMAGHILEETELMGRYSPLSVTK